MIRLAARSLVLASAASLTVSAPAASARATTSVEYSPWAALSAFASPASSQALCGAAATAAAAQGVTTGCMFPVLDAPVAPAAAEAAQVGSASTVTSSAAIGVLPLLAGLALIGGVAGLLLGSGEGQAQISVSP